MFYIKKSLKKSGQIVYRFRYYDKLNENKLTWPPVDLTPTGIRSDKEAEQFCKRWDAEHDAAHVIFSKRRQWENKYFHFVDLTEQFENYIKGKAKNSWESQMNYLNHYVLHWFLKIRELGN